MNKKIVFISDLHIRNVSRYSEYKEIFKKTVNKIKSLNPDYIINGGDTFHQKLVLSPESIYLAKRFFTDLGKICPVYSIVGNHDCNLNNLNRMDAISAVFKNIPNNIVLKLSQLYKLDDEINLGICSIFDSEEKWPLNGLDKDKINIALYHGPLDGAKTDSNYKLDTTSINPKIFNNYDFVFAGDIHSRFPYDKAQKMWSIGNLIQQNFGESDKKGFLVLKINDEGYEIKFELIKNDYNHITLNLIDENFDKNKLFIIKSLKEKHVTKNTKLRLIYNIDESISKEYKNNIKHFIMENYNIDVIFSEKMNDANQNLEIKNLNNKALNFQDRKVQNKLLENYIKHKPGFEDLYKNKAKLFDINKSINDKLGYNKIEKINADWFIEKLQFENIFCFKQDNSIDFNNLNGLIGLYGRNASGKSSVFNILTYSIFGRTLKKTKALNILNHDVNSGWVNVYLKRNDIKYKISRQLIANRSRTSAKNTVNFEMFDKLNNSWESLNEETIPQTNKKITEFFGDIHEFIMTSMSTQDNYNVFIELGNTDRKEIIMRYLGLGVYNKLYEKVNEELKELKIIISSIDNFDEDLDKLKSYRQKINSIKEDRLSHNKKIKSIEKSIKNNKVKQLSLEERLITITNMNNTPEQLKLMLNKSLENKNIITKLLLNDLDDIKILKNKIDEKKYKKELLIESKNKKIKIETELELINIDLEENIYTEKIDCDKYSCPLLVNYETQKQKWDDKNKKNKSLNKNLLNINKIIKTEEEKLNIVNYIEKKKKNILINKDKLEDNKKVIIKIKNEQDSINKNKNEIKKNNVLTNNIKELVTIISDDTMHKIQLESDIKANKKLEIEFEKRFEEINTNINKVAKIKEEYKILEQYKNIIDPNALPNLLLYNYLNKFEVEVNKILNDSVGLKIQAELIKKVNNKTIDLDLEYKSESSSKYLPIELASGAEKLFLSIAIRVGLIKLTSLQKTDTLIIDEGFSSLHSSNLNKLPTFFNIIKESFKRIIIVTHIEQIQDLPDTIITIKKNDKGETQINI